MQGAIVSERLAMVALMVALIVVGWFAMVYAVDNAIDRQNIMLCKSAQISGNEKWLELCQEYYKTGEYIYLRDL